MKSLLALFISASVVAGGLFMAYLHKESNQQIVAQSCCESGLATCTGSKSCSACKNCKYCKHCAKNGGTCGVCK